MIGNYDRSQRRYFIKDHLGSIRTTVDQNGAVDGYTDYYPFGLAMPGRSWTNQADPLNANKFTGHERDEEASLTLDYMMARNYDPMIGRFLQIDPMLEYASPYTYVGNNPLRLVDPTGKYSADTDVAIPNWENQQQSNCPEEPCEEEKNEKEIKKSDYLNGGSFSLAGVAAKSAKYVSWGEGRNVVTLRTIGNPTVSKGIFVNLTKYSKLAGNGLGVIGVGYTGYQYINGEVSGLEASIDATFAVVAFIPGGGTIVAATYFGGKFIYEYSTGKTVFEKPKGN